MRLKRLGPLLLLICWGCEPSAPPADTASAPPLVIYTPERWLPPDYQPLDQGLWVDTFQVIRISISEQNLRLFEAGKEVAHYPISSAKKGIGNRDGSYQTPLGAHRICRKAGQGLAPGAVLRNAVPTGEQTPIYFDTADRTEDLVTTRVLWLEGLEPGKNRGHGVDSYYRFIYIHGTPEEGLIGSPASHGCIRMRNRDVIALYDRVRMGTSVVIAP